jgi:FKBP-type peptidyl-prolyl cis-trans isomerase
MLMLSALLLSMPLLAPTPQGGEPVIPKDTEIVTTPSGLKYSVLAPGAGERPKTDCMVKVHYSGWLTDGTPVDSSVKKGVPFEFVLGRRGVIAGWDEGVALMPKGARYKFTIPANLAWGAQGRPPSVPPDATVVFEIELLDFTPLPAFVAAKPEAQVKLESGVVYEVLTPGEGESPTAGKLCELEYALFTTGGHLLDCSAMQRKNIKDMCGKSNLAFMNEILPLMKPGARWRVEPPAALCFGGRAVGPELPPNSPTVWEVKLLGVTTPPPLPEFRALDAQRATTTKSGLKYEVLREGTGKKPKLGQQIKVHYAVWLTDGTPIDASFNRGEAGAFQLGRNMITGWSEGLQLMPEGAAYMFEIPAGLAYGAAGRRPAIPPDATLIFYIELMPAE